MLSGRSTWSREAEPEAGGPVGLALRVDEQREGDPGLLAERAGVRGVPEADRRQAGAPRPELGLVVAQLRDVLPAEDSAVVPEEDDDGRRVGPERAQADRLAVRVRQDDGREARREPGGRGHARRRCSTRRHRSWTTRIPARARVSAASAWAIPSWSHTTRGFTARMSGTWGGMSRGPPEDVHHVDRRGHVTERPVDPAPEDLDDVRVVDGNRDDVVALAQHVLRHEEGGRARSGLGLDPEDGDPAALAHDLRDAGGVGDEVLAPVVHGRSVRLRRAHEDETAGAPPLLDHAGPGGEPPTVPASERGFGQSFA